MGTSKPTSKLDRRAIQKAYDAARYGTEAYRKRDRDYKCWRYANDPAFRWRVQASVARYKARRKATP
jgi:hypothetical protein